jgi:hypothetical protein
LPLGLGFFPLSRCIGFQAQALLFGALPLLGLYALFFLNA